MLERCFTWPIQLFVFGILFVLILFMPRLARKGIVFGIRVPERYAGETEKSRIITSCMKSYAVINIPVICLLMWLSVRYENERINLAGIIVFITVSFSFLTRHGKKMRT